MKPAPFDLRRPATLEAALADLAELADAGRPLAGGQSLIPLLNFRMSQPEVLVDLSAVEELRYIRRTADGGLSIGAMTTQTALLESAVIAESHPVVRDTVAYVAHEPIRNRGTLGGSLAHLDPSAEMPALALLLDAEVAVAGAAGERRIAMRDFVRGPYTTALDEGELLTQVTLPPLPAGAGTAVEEFAQRAGDFAVAGAAALVTLDPAGSFRELRVVVFGACSQPTRLDQVERDAVGERPEDGVIDAICDAYASGISAMDDRSGSAAFRRHLTSVLVGRVIRAAVAAHA